MNEEGEGETDKSGRNFGGLLIVGSARDSYTANIIFH